MTTIFLGKLICGFFPSYLFRRVLFLEGTETRLCFLPWGGGEGLQGGRRSSLKAKSLSAFSKSGKTAEECRMSSSPSERAMGFRGVMD